MKLPNHIISKALLTALMILATLTVQFAQYSEFESLAEKAIETDEDSLALDYWRKAANEYITQEDASSECRIYIRMCKYFMHKFQMDTVKHYAHLLRRTAEKNELGFEIMQAYNTLSVIHGYMGEQDSIMIASPKILNSNYAPVDYKSDALTQRAMVYDSRMQLDSAEITINEAIKLDSMYQDSSSIPFNLAFLARLKQKQFKRNEALSLLFEAIKFLREDVDKFKFATLYTEISSVFLSTNNIHKAEEYATKALEICDQLKLKTSKIDPLIYLGFVNIHRNNTKRALEIFESAKEISNSKNRILSDISIELGLAQCFTNMDQYEIAASHLNKASELISSIKNKSFEFKFDFIEAIFNLKTNAPDAVSYATTVYNRAKNEKNLYYELKLAKEIANNLNRNQRNKMAFDYLLNSYKLQDSLYSFEQSLFTQDLEAKYQKKEQENQIQLLASENKLKSTQLKQQSLLIWGTTIALAIIAGMLLLIFMLYKKHKNQKEIAEKSLNDKNVLLREIHHRVKNNLQVISSLLALQSKYIDDDSALSALQQGQDRVQSMALIHEDLYRSENITGVDAELYFEQLIDNLMDSYNIHEDNIAIQINVDPLSLEVDTMIPLGLILNELVSNSLKHAFKDSEKGMINVSLIEQKDKLILEVKDNGSKIKSIDEIDGKSFGYELIKAFSRKLKAEMELYIEDGLGIRLTIKEYKLAA